MNASELKESFDQNQVPTMFYSIGRPTAGDCLALEQSAGQWEINYYSERDNCRSEGTYTSKDEACRAMFTVVGKIMKEEENRVIQ